VTVIVDFTAFGAGVVTRCVAGTPSSGVDALADAGFDVAQVASGPGFVCRIDERPGPAEESCATTPPATAYWSYWTAPRGGAWAYSPAGPAGSRPAEGTVEGWAFVDGGVASPPGIPSPPLAAPTPRPTPAATAAPTPRPTLAPPAPSTPAPAPASAAASLTQPNPSDPERPSPTPTASPTPSPAPTTASASQAAASAVPDRSGTAGRDVGGAGPLGTVAGIGLIAAVGGLAIVVQRRSRAMHRG
jgi:hypothetical protein